MAATAAYIAIIVGVGAGIYFAATADTPEYPTPTAANYYYYNEDGTLDYKLTWDEERQGYIYQTYSTDEEKEEDAKRDEIRAKMLDYLDSTPEDRIKAYDEYAETFSAALQREVDDSYEGIKSSTEEDMARRGMTGSRADVDTTAALAGEKLEADTEVAESAEMAKYYMEDARSPVLP